jgi:hypothetical protein
MFHSRTHSASDRRRAVILMVVLVLLTLFAIVGLAFVLYANAEGEASRVYRETNIGNNVINISPNSLASFAIGQLLFDQNDPVGVGFPANAWSALRGHSLARDLYGWDLDSIAQNVNTNIYPFNGVGHLHTGANTYQNIFNIDDHLLPNYVPFLADGFVRDPERLAKRANLTVQPSPTTQPYTGGWNSSYTYADGNHVFLGAMDADGYFLVQSFHRPWIFGPLYDPNNPTNPQNNPNWTNPQGKYMLLRPRPAEHLGFPYPTDAGGDVKNLQGYPGGNDSVWLDLDYPVQTAPNGTKFKPLFAFFITDLDGRININTAANIRATAQGAPFHGSNQGHGKWEVNPAQLASNVLPNAMGEWSQLLQGGNGMPGRYGNNGQPTGRFGQAVPVGPYQHVYGQRDFDAVNEMAGGKLTQFLPLPATLPNSFPSFPAGYGNTNPMTEGTNHPLLYDAQYPVGSDRAFRADNLTGLLNGGNQSPTALATQLGQLLPNNLGTLRIRNMMTTDSAALGRPGLTPWIWDRTVTNGYTANTRFPPTGNPSPFPALTSRTGPVPQFSDFRIPNAQFPNNAAAIDWRAVDVTVDSSTFAAALLQSGALTSALAKVNLNRFLSPYPHQGQGGAPSTYQPTPVPGCNLDTPFNIDAPNGPIYNQYLAAVNDRQNLANDIYRRLLLVTGVPPVGTPATPQPSDLAPRRWLAQLAANIVDLIDEDEISTPFNFYNTQVDGAANAGLTAPLGTQSNGTPGVDQNPAYWVFGTELPRVLLNEVLAEYPKPASLPATNVPVNVFVELYNPIPATPGVNTDPILDPNPVLLYNTTGGYSPYQVVIADNALNVGGGPNLPGLAVTGTAMPNNNDLVLGTPDLVYTTANITAGATIVGTATSAPSQIGGQAVNPVQNPQFFLLGPSASDLNKSINTNPPVATGVVPPGTPMLVAPSMSYKVNIDALGNWKLASYATGPTLQDIQNLNGAPIGVNVLLRRLINPHLPPSGPIVLPGDPLYNPYITVDYIGGGYKSGGNNLPGGARVNQNDGTTSTYASLQKLQPCAAYPTQLQMGQSQGKALTTYDTFGALNLGAAGPANAPANYDWLVHLDRHLVSAMELLHLSGFQPYDLTRQFYSPPPGGGVDVKFNHRVDWYNEQNRLYRAFEVLGTADRAAGVSPSGRQPGMININTVNDLETFRALCDANGVSNSFAPPVVDGLFWQMLALRSPGMKQGIQPGQRAVTGQDRPFLGMGIGNMPAGDVQFGILDDGQTAKTYQSNGTPSATGIEDTFLRSVNGSPPTGLLNTEQPRLFQVPGATHPYQQIELMNKIYGNLTNRSNVFAVWMTVGFFQVMDATVRPVKLGPEIGLNTGTNIRHQIFTVLDRTQMYTTTSAAAQLAAPVTVTGPPVTAPVQVSALSGNINGMPWSIQAGSAITIDPGPAGNGNEETVVVQAVATGPPMTFTATFTKPHGAQATIVIPGNPGPQSSFSITSPPFPNLVLTYSVLK